MLHRRQRRHKSDYWLHKVTQSHQILGRVEATNTQRRAARCRLNKAAKILQALVDVAPMGQVKREVLLGRTK